MLTSGYVRLTKAIGSMLTLSCRKETYQSDTNQNKRPSLLTMFWLRNVLSILSHRQSWVPYTIYWKTLRLPRLLFNPDSVRFRRCISSRIFQSKVWNWNLKKLNTLPLEVHREPIINELERRRTSFPPPVLPDSKFSYSSTASVRRRKRTQTLNVSPHDQKSHPRQL